MQKLLIVGVVIALLISLSASAAGAYVGVRLNSQVASLHGQVHRLTTANQSLSQKLSSLEGANTQAATVADLSQQVGGLQGKVSQMQSQLAHTCASQPVSNEASTLTGEETANFNNGSPDNEYYADLFAIIDAICGTSY